MFEKILIVESFTVVRLLNIRRQISGGQNLEQNQIVSDWFRISSPLISLTKYLIQFTKQGIQVRKYTFSCVKLNDSPQWM